MTLLGQNKCHQQFKINLIMIMGYEKNSDRNKYIDSERVIILWEVSKDFLSERFDMFVICMIMQGSILLNQ